MQQEILREIVEKVALGGVRFGRLFVVHWLKNRSVYDPRHP